MDTRLLVAFRPNTKTAAGIPWLILHDNGGLSLDPHTPRGTGEVSPEDAAILYALACSIEPLESCAGKYEDYSFRVFRPDGSSFARTLGFDWDSGVEISPYRGEVKELVAHINQSFLSLWLECHGTTNLELAMPAKYFWRSRRALPVH